MPSKQNYKRRNAAIAGLLPFASGIGAGSEMLKPPAIAGVGGVLSSMVLFLVLTSAIHCYLQRGNAFCFQVFAVNFCVDPEAESAGYDKMTSLLKIHLKNGSFIAGRADFGKGSPANPMTFEEAAEKFRGCAEYADWPKVKTERIIAFVRALDSAPDVRALSPLLSAERE